MPSPDYWKQSKEFLSNADPKLAKLISNHREYSISSRGDALESLLRSIIGQQISVQAAASVWGKFEKKIEIIEPKNVLTVSFEELKSCGLSKQKVQYITNICNHFINNQITDHSYWKERTYKSVYDELITIKGIGPWTAEMFGMFYLLEKDIFPIKDVGIIRAINQLYGNGKSLSIENIIAISDTWIPYRSVACWFLWKSIDSEDVLY
ncbi:MAG: hypothetical protein VYD29_00055 [Pseudomonadota bacterium]|nr:hypothetical protein [Pseudomonadota bacterium]